MLEPYAGRSVYRHRGARVVHGQRLVQLGSDLFLGWNSLDEDQHYYWRQLRDMKASAEIGLLTAKHFARYVDACAWCLANAHARSGDPISIAAYLGDGEPSTRRWPSSRRPTPTRQADWKALKTAIADGRGRPPADV